VSGRSELTRRLSPQNTEQTIKLVLIIGLVGGFLLVLSTVTLFAWNQWLDDWPLLERDAFKTLSEAETTDLALSDNNFHSDTSRADNLENGNNLSASSQSKTLPPDTTPGPLQAKPIIHNANVQRPRWTPTPLPTSTPIPTPSPMPTFISEVAVSGPVQPAGLQPGEKWIDVNVSSQTLVAFEGGAPVHQSLVSTGTTNHPTVKGQFRIWLRFPSQDMNGYRLGYDYYLQGVPYVQYFYQDYALHGTFWHNNFGTPMSHGCINLPNPTAEWLYNWADYGTLVNVH